MAYTPLFLHPGTPLEKEVDLEHARQWMRAGLLADNTPCARAPGSVPIPLKDMLRAVDIGRAVMPLAEDGSPDERLLPGGGYRPLRADETAPGRIDPLRPYEREYLIAFGLVAPRYVDDITHTQAVGMIRRHRLGRWAAGTLKWAVVFVLIGGAYYWGKDYIPGWATAPTAAASSPVPAEANPASAQTPSQPAVVAAQPKPRLTRAQELAARRTAASVDPTQNWTAETFGGRIGVLYDKAKGGVALGRCGGAFLGERDKHLYLLIPVSALAQAQQPAVAMLNGKVIELAPLPMCVFGDKDMVGFFLGTTSVGPNANDDETSDGLPLGAALNQNGQNILYQLGLADSLSPSLLKRQNTLSRTVDGALLLRKSPDKSMLGDPMVNAEGRVVACVARPNNNLNPDKFILLLMEELPAPMATTWDDFLRERALCQRMAVRTQTLKKVADGDFTISTLPDRTVSVLFRSTADKATAASARYTESLRDTTKLQETFKTQLRQLAKADLARFTIPYFAAQANVHNTERQQALEQIESFVTMSYLIDRK